MNESENNFNSLRRLLALKRHEIPPPGFFNHFSSRVVSRISAGETDVPQGTIGASWLMKLFQVFEARPAYVGSFACSLCLLLLLGIVYAERPEAMPKTALFASVTQPVVAFADATSPVLSPAPAQTGLMVSTNPFLNLQAGASLFGQPNPLAQPVSFPLPGN